MIGQGPQWVSERSGKAFPLATGQTVRVINTLGQQVVDSWAFAQADLTEVMSMEHTRASLSRIFPRVGDSLVTNRRRSILTVAADTSPGVHDTLIAACDRYRYEQLGCKEYHDNCTDNLRAALAALGLTPPETPSPFNLFMNIPVAGDGSVSFEAPLCKAGDYIALRAEMDCIVALSACPQDLLPINGTDRKPTGFSYEIVAPERGVRTTHA
jgi:uncharacterized protein YcgI (DUF1989 family)